MAAARYSEDSGSAVFRGWRQRAQSLIRLWITSLFLTFRLRGLTLRIVIYNQFRTMISMVIVLAVAVGFLWGGSRLLNSVTGAAPPPPTPTVKPAIEQPTVAPTATPHPKGAPGGSAHPTVPAAPTATPRPSPTPNTPTKVFMTAREFDKTPVTTFHLSQGLSSLWCHARNSALPPGTTTMTFYWTKDEPNGFLNQFALGLQSGPFTDAYYQYVAAHTGTYRCDVIINNQTFGSVHFTVAP